MSKLSSLMRFARVLRFAAIVAGSAALAACGGGTGSSSSSSSGSTSSSSSSSSSSGGGDPTAGAAQFALCADCHSPNNDGTFGSGRMLIDFDNLRTDGARANLLQYIAENMPPNSANASCGIDCAADIVAYMRSLIPGSSSSSSSSSGGGTPLPGGSVEAGLQIFDESCASCHSGERTTGLWSEEALRDKQLFTAFALQNYIEQSMPPGNPGACDADCAASVTAYIATWNVLPMSPMISDELSGQQDNPIRGEACSVAGEQVAGYRALRLLTQVEYQTTIRSLLGVEYEDLFALPADASIGAYRNNNDRFILGRLEYEQYLTAAEQIAAAADSADWPTLNCNGQYNSQCVNNFLDSFAPKVMRRGLTEQERSTYNELANGMATDGDIREGLQVATAALLSSPQFLYRHELGDDSGGRYLLTGEEIATFLSYTFAGNTPSAVIVDGQDLLSMAQAGQLNTEDGIRNAVSNLLSDNQTQAAVQARLSEMARSWLGTAALAGAAKDQTLYPGLDANIRSAMVTEVEQLFSNEMLSENGSFETLFAPGTTYLNSELASFYGVGGGNGANFSRTTGLTDRGGLLLSGAFLTLHGDSDEASPIRRAVNVRRNFLCQDMPAPPEGVDVGRSEKAGELGEFLDRETTTNRMAFHRLTEAQGCLDCHAELINPLGFGLEDYDTLGRFRAMDMNGNEINAKGALYSPYLDLQFFGDPERDTAHYEFEGGKELAQMLASGEASDLTKACLAMQVVSFSSGIDVLGMINSERPNAQRLADDERASYACGVDSLVSAMDTGSLRAMLESLGAMDFVRYRQAWAR